MAIINVELDNQNLSSVNGEYTFTTNFYNATTGELLNDIRFPQNQVHTTTTVTNPYYLPVSIADGLYNISNVKLKIAYKDKILEYTIPPTSVDCIESCSIFPILQVNKISNTTYSVTLSSSSDDTVNWKILNTSNVAVANGVSNISGNSFIITTATLPTGSYLLELVGSTCKGRDIKVFTTTPTLSPCTAGPTLFGNISNISPTGLTFGFDGISVFGITWRIKQGSSILRTGVVKHVSVALPGDATYNNSSPSISFAPLVDGVYTLEIEGESCSSSISSNTFTVNTASVPLSFISGSPSVTGSAGNYTMSISINKSGAYNTVILNSTTGTYYQNGNITYTANTPYIKTALPVGTYAVSVGSLQTTIVIQNTGGSPCTLGPNITNIFSASPVGVQFQFDGVGVSAITWRVKQAGNTVRTGVVYPINNSPFISFNELGEGTYTLEIEGNNCSSTPSSSVFSIVAIPQGNNAGVITTTVGNKYIGIINAKDFRAVANPTTGAVRLLYNEISTADQGSKQVKGWLLDSQLCEVPASEVALLRSSNGLVLPNDNYHFYLYYAATDTVSTYAQLRNQLWTLFLNPETWPLNSKTLEEVIIEVTNI